MKLALSLNSDLGCPNLGCSVLVWCCNVEALLIVSVSLGDVGVRVLVEVPLLLGALLRVVLLVLS